jgi:N-acetylneuraminic acid mutarotase
MESLLSPLIDLSNNIKFLRFDFAHCPNYPLDDKLKIEVSSDGGNTFDTIRILHGYPGGELNTVLWGNGNFVPDSSQWQTKTFILPNNTNRVRFTAISENGDNLYLDNIQVGEITNKDAGVYNVDINKFVLPGEFTPKYTVKNYGKDTISFDVKLTIGSYESRTTVTDLPPGTKKQIFGEPFNILPGDYKAAVSTLLYNDQNIANDTMSYNYYVINSAWQQGDSLPFPCSMGSCSAIVKDDTGYVVICGGDINHNASDLAAIYNVNSETWSLLPVIPEPKIALASVIVGDYFYAISGARSLYDNVASPKVYALNIKTKLWEAKADIPLSVGLHKAAAYQDSLIYVLGGTHNLAVNTHIFLYNINEDQWRDIGIAPVPSLAGAMTIYNNKIIYLGGSDGSEKSAKATTFIGEIQPDHKIVWHQGADYPLGPRFRWNAAPWGEKGVIVLNGCKSAYWASENECYVYNPENDTWHIMPPKIFNTCGTQIASLKIYNQMKLFALGGYYQSISSKLNEVFVDSIYTPVELNSFTSSTADNNVALFWSTATEKNNYGFEIERKSSEKDYNSISFIKGNGTTTEIKNYTYTDKNLPSGIYSYRLKQIDQNGEYKYYNLAGEIKIGQPAAYSLSQNYPNPFNPNTRIKYSIKDAVPVKIEIFDILGRKAATIVNEIKQPGEYEVNFNGNNLASGIYFYKLTAGTFTQIRKMQLLK